MAEVPINLSAEVTGFLDKLDHPFRKEIEQLRFIILSAETGLTESIKWNGPNYSFAGEDRITMRIHPPKQLQLIFHRGAKVKTQPKDKLIQEDFKLLVWKENDRAVASFKNGEELMKSADNLKSLIKSWIIAAS
ncbi:MAG: DUF1801 domain-containing protein [Algoriphagus sp.]|nr:DUF1801 domain-containing protein [Algoriphagus sp.]